MAERQQVLNREDDREMNDPAQAQINTKAIQTLIQDQRLIFSSYNYLKHIANKKHLVLIHFPTKPIGSDDDIYKKFSKQFLSEEEIKEDSIDEGVIALQNGQINDPNVKAYLFRRLSEKFLCYLDRSFDKQFVDIQRTVNKNMKGSYLQKQMTTELLRDDSTIIKEHVSTKQLKQWGHGPSISEVHIDVDKVTIIYTCMFDIHEALISNVGTKYNITSKCIMPKKSRNDQKVRNQSSVRKNRRSGSKGQKRSVSFNRRKN